MALFEMVQTLILRFANMEKWINSLNLSTLIFRTLQNIYIYIYIYTGELGYDGPLYDGFLHMTDDMLGPSPLHIKYSSYVYDGFCI